MATKTPKATPPSGIEQTATARDIDPAAAALATAAGLNPNDLTDDELAELVAAADDDAARSGDPGSSSTDRSLVREANNITSDDAISLLFYASERFGFSPNANKQPQELLAWKFYKGRDDLGAPDAVSVVLAGGLKLKMFDDGTLDADTEDRLRRVFGCYQQDPRDKSKIVVLPLPADLSLPGNVLHGQVVSTDHQYQGGYLKSGGRAAADEKAARREQRLKRFTSLPPGQV